MAQKFNFVVCDIMLQDYDRIIAYRYLRVSVSHFVQLEKYSNFK